MVSAKTAIAAASAGGVLCKFSGLAIGACKHSTPGRKEFGNKLCRKAVFVRDFFEIAGINLRGTDDVAIVGDPSCAESPTLK